MKTTSHSPSNNGDNTMRTNSITRKGVARYAPTWSLARLWLATTLLLALFAANSWAQEVTTLYTNNFPNAASVSDWDGVRAAPGSNIYVAWTAQGIRFDDTRGQVTTPAIIPAFSTNLSITITAWNTTNAIYMQTSTDKRVWTSEVQLTSNVANTLPNGTRYIKFRASNTYLAISSVTITGIAGKL